MQLVQQFDHDTSWTDAIRIWFSEAKYEVLKLWRSPAFAIPTLAFPWAFYCLFGIVLNFSGQMGVYLLPAYGTFGVIGPALFGFGVGVSTERAAGWLKLKQVSPMPAWTYIGAKILMSLAFALAICIGLFLLASLVAGVRLQFIQWLQLGVMLLLGTVPFCVMGLAIGFWVKGQAAVAVVNLIYLPMAVLSGLWFPLQLFPDFMQQLAWALPPFHLAQLCLKVVGMDMGHAWWMHLLALVAFSLVFGLLALAGYRRDDGRNNA